MHPLLSALTGSFLTLNPGDTLYSNIRAASSEWRELAYTELRSGASNQFYTGNETFGPRWTSLMDPAHAPVLLVRKLGAGEVVVAQMGRWLRRNRGGKIKVWAIMRQVGRTR